MVNFSDDKENFVIKMAKVAALSAGAIGVASGVVNGWDTIQEGEKGVVTTFGRADYIIDSGLAFHWPWQFVKEMNVQSQTENIELEVYSKDSQLAPKNVLSVTFSLPSENVLDVYSKYGPDYFEKVIKNPVENIFRECFGRLTADQIIADRELLNSDVSKKLEAEFTTRGLDFERISISIKFNDAFNLAAEESAIARIKVNTERQNLERLGIEAQQIVVTAKAQSDASLETKKSDALGIEAVGAAEAKVIKLKVDAASSNPEYARILAAEKWDGTLPKTMIPGQTMPFIDLTTPSAQK